MWEVILFWAGISFQLVGVVLTLIGVSWIWQDVKSSGDRFLAPFIEAGQWLARSVRGLFKRPAPQVFGVGGGGSASAVGRGGFYNTPPALPDNLSVDERIAFAYKQVQDSVGKIYQEMFQIDSNLREEIQKTKSEHRRAFEAADALADEKRRRAVSAVRLEAYGFLLLTIGTMLQAWGSYLGID